MPSFISNLLKMASGTVIAQVVAIILIPVVTRLYPPEFFGVNQLFLSIAAVILVVSTLSYHFTIMVTEREEDSVNLLGVCVVCLLGISTGAGVVFVGFADWFGSVFNTPLIADYFVWLPLYIILSSLIVVLNEWLSRKVRYGVIARGIVTNTVSTRVIQIGGGLIHASPLGLILGSVIGAGLATLSLLRGLKEDTALLKTVTGGQMKALAARYKHFSLYASLGSLANSVSWELPAFMLAYFFNPTVVGYYALAIMAVKLPMAMVGKSITQVFFQKASEERIQTGDVKNVVREVHTRLISVGIFPFIIFVILAQDLFTFIFGANWLTAGTYAMILAPWTFAVFIISPISSLFGVLDRQRAFFFFELLTLCALTLLFSIGGTFGDPVIALTLFSIGGVFIWGAKSAYLIKEAEAGYRDSVLSLTRHLLLSIVVSLPLIIAKFAGIPFLLLLGVAGVTAVAYYLRIFFTDALIRKEVLRMIRGSVSPRHVRWMERLGLFREQG
ncbi:lipopolysaccharide biosynthesis protein [Methanoculleus sp.]|jgi:O-antigen/teichoic acid export membrane protein|uniref:lipopolysaccharide biosynthesis protein n=1 Tax=Methanoculleus sp. TaxID=90427 RepID=UPI001BD525CE|nr:oligosaccharide flippase family protein [Methanoculleus sp.]